MTTDTEQNITYRNAEETDCDLILHYIKELAEYEKMLHEVTATPALIKKHLFGPNPKAFAMISEMSGKPVGFALCFYNFSTFQGKPGIYLEDLYVEPDYRGHGIGKGFFKAIAERAIEEDCGRVQWWVLDWNAPSIKFYEKLGATSMKEWITYRLEGDQISNVAALKIEERLDRKTVAV